MKINLNKILLGLTIGLVSFGCFLFSSKSEFDAQALQLGYQALESNKPLEAISFFSKAKKIPPLSNWANLGLAQAYEMQGDLNQAKKLYSDLAQKTTAPSLDAQVSLARLKNPSTLPIEDLKIQLTRAQRRDLNEEILFIEARNKEDNNELQNALEIYQQLRQEASTKTIRETARTRAIALQNLDTWQSLTQEAKQLLSENELISALDFTQQAQAKQIKNSPEYLQISLLKQKILRKMGRKLEADNVLITTSLVGDQEPSAEAMLELVKNLWNSNQQNKALLSLSKFKQRFPNSKLTEKAIETEAKILAEYGQLNDAKDLFLNLSKTTTDPLQQVRSIEQAAWLYYIEGNFLQSTELFEQAANQAKKLIPFFSHQTTQLRPQISNTSEQQNIWEELNAELQHSLYWKLLSLTKIDPQNLNLLSFPIPDLTAPGLKDLSQQIININPEGYYAMQLTLAEKPFTLSNNLTTQDLSHPAGFCELKPPPDLITILNIFNPGPFSDPILSLLSKREIDFYLPIDPSLSPSSIKTEITRAKLYTKYGNIAQAIFIATKLRKTLAYQFNSDSEILGCQKEIVKLSFPIPEINLFSEAASAAKIKPSLLLAITKNESGFDPKIVSSAGALGLAQLMPDTAKAEGLLQVSELFDPKLNLQIGAKHLAHLLDVYDNNVYYAIAAYNAGQTAVNRWRERYPMLDPQAWTELIAYPETKKYVKRVLTSASVYKSLTNHNLVHK